VALFFASDRYDQLGGASGYKINAQFQSFQFVQKWYEQKCTQKIESNQMQKHLINCFSIDKQITKFNVYQTTVYGMLHITSASLKSLIYSIEFMFSCKSILYLCGYMFIFGKQLRFHRSFGKYKEKIGAQ
jgi:hypothetical protein